MRNIVTKVVNGGRYLQERANHYALMGSVGVGSFLASNAYAGPLADAWEAEASDAKGELLAIGAVVLAVIGVIFLINRSKRVAS